jgi:ribosomal protein S18 acetylase RimI-like enzyme
MHMKRGEERIQKRHETTELSEDHAERIADIMKTVYPVFWGDTTAESILESMDRIYWIGIERQGRIVSIANTQFADFGSNIGVVATDEAFRNKGYATSVVSSLVAKILERSDTALIHVLASNDPAIHVYEKVGFKPFKSYLLMKGERISQN